MFFRQKAFYRLGYERFSARYAKISYPKEWYTVVVTCFYIGRIPLFPGTLASLLAYPVYTSVIENAIEIYEVTDTLWLFAIYLLITGVFAISLFQSATGSYDHDSVVIDELVGMFCATAIAFVPSINLAKFITDMGYFTDYPLISISFFVIFIVYRLFDIIKPLVIGWIERYARSSFGVMLDNIASAIAAGYTISLIWELISRYAI